MAGFPQERKRRWTWGFWQGVRTDTRTPNDYVRAAYDQSRRRGRLTAQEDEIVPVYDLAPVLGVELAGGPAEQLRQFRRVVPDQAAGPRHAAPAGGRRPAGRAEQLDRVAGTELAAHPGHPRGQQRGAPADDRVHRTGVE